MAGLAVARDRRGTWLLLVAMSLGQHAAFPGERGSPGESMRNWFGDPFVQTSADVVGCPVPRGPFATELEFRQQSHRRAENGASCWLSGACEKPSAYADDHEIAEQLVRSAGPAGLLRGTSLWLTVQAGIVYIEGCVTSAAMERPLEAHARSIPGVRQVVVLLRSDDAAKPPYATLRRGPE